MSTLPEQFSAVRKSQVEAQINFFHNFTARSLESVQKMIALNLSVSRASMEKSSAAVTQLLTVKDPRDLLALTNNSQESLNGMLAYSRELFAIATGTGVALADAAVKAVPELKAASLAQVKPEAQPWTEPAPAAAEFVAPVAEPEPVQAAAMTATPAAPPEAQAKPIAKAVGKVASKAVAAKPAAAPVAAATKDAPTVVTGIKPVEASPPPAPVSGTPAIAQQQLDLPAAKSKKKK
jgi:phasin family protein